MDFPRRTKTLVFVFYFSKVQYYIKKRRRGRTTSLGSSFTCGLSSVERSTCVGRSRSERRRKLFEIYCGWLG